MKLSRTLSTLAIAVVAGLAAMVFSMRHDASQVKQEGTVAVANVDIEMGTKILPEMVTIQAWPAGGEPAGSFKTIEELNGRVVKSQLVRGEPVLNAKLAPVGTTGGLSAVVAEGKRAMTVRVNDVIGVAGFALPGNYVDIMVNTKRDGAETNDKVDDSISKIVLKRILVLAVAQEADRDDTKPKVVNAVTLEVSPEQAENLDLARSVGSLSLVLRNQVDTAEIDTEGGTKATMLQELVKQKAVIVASTQPRPKAVKRTKPQVTVQAKTECVEVIRGGDLTKACF